ncbi:MAG TPA: hypothetical protein VM120_09445 [Bryobacteraceae bacterium]|nr:hypothetical protein [Bryobacteraceae bacterium]
MRLLLAVLLFAPAARAQPEAIPAKTAQALTRGQQIATAVSTVTSTAVSPLLGVSVLGAYEHFKTPAELRHTLPSYTSPWFWIPVIVLLTLILCKDTIGGAAPLLKKPLDAVEVLMLNKASLLLIGFPVVFHEAAKILGMESVFRMFSFIPAVYAQDAASAVQKAGTASVAFLLIVAGVLITTAVWMVGHAIDVLVLLSPFPFLDVLLKGARSVVFAVLAACALFEPRLGAALSAFVILISFLLAGWAFRLLVFGAVFSSDLLRTLVLNRYKSPQPGQQLAGFTARRIRNIPNRAYGHLRRREDGGLEFCHHPWLFGSLRSARLDDTAGYEIGRGLFYPLLLQASTTMVRFLPRYRQSEESLAALLGVKGVRDTRFGHGLHSFWKWLREGETVK